MGRSLGLWASVLVLIVGLWGALALPAGADDLTAPTAAALFTQHCAGCHVNGGNIVRRGKTLKLKALERNGLTSAAAIAPLIAHGKGAMSAYGDRLTPAEIDLLATYVWENAQQDWPR